MPMKYVASTVSLSLCLSLSLSRARARSLSRSRSPSLSRALSLSLSRALTLGMRKTLLKTIRMYREDKNPERAHGLEWHLLCRQITKVLNAKLELYK